MNFQKGRLNYCSAPFLKPLLSPHWQFRHWQVTLPFSPVMQLGFQHVQELTCFSRQICFPRLLPSQQCEVLCVESFQFPLKPHFCKYLDFFRDKKSQLYIYLELPNTLKRIYLRFQAPWLNNKNTISLKQTNVYTPAASKSPRAKNYSCHRFPRKQTN